MTNSKQECHPWKRIAFVNLKSSEAEETYFENLVYFTQTSVASLLQEHFEGSSNESHFSLICLGVK